MAATDTTLPRIESDDDGHPIFHHDCGGTTRRTILKLNRETGWWWTDDGHLMPSVHCHACGTHGWWRGKQGWVTA